MTLRAAIFVVVACLIAVFPRLAEAYTPPSITGHVTDPLGKLTETERLNLDKKLDEYRRCSSKEIAAFIAPSLGGETIEDVAHGTFNTWKIGRGVEDNGVLLVIAPERAPGSHRDRQGRRR